MTGPPVRVASSGQVAIIIPCHNYGRFLDECLKSVAAQTHRAAEVIVVDDASDPGDEALAICQRLGVQYKRVEYRNVYLTRKAGLDATSSPLVVFLDADDCLAPTYIAECLAVMQADEAIAIVTSDMTRFGSRDGRLHYPDANLERSNYIHAGSMVRRIAITVTGAYERPVPTTQSHADWYVWREIVRGGWGVGRIAAASYLYRQHGDSMMEARGKVGFGYYAEASLEHESITLVLPLSGRARYWDRLSKWAASQTRVTDVLVIDSSSDPAFRSRVKQWLTTLDVRSAKFVSLPPSNGLADSNRRGVNAAYRAVQAAMPRIYRHLRESVTTEYLMIVEDDVLPPPDAIEGLLHSMGRDIAAVSGIVPSRWQNSSGIVWDASQKTLPLARNTGAVESVGGTGFGCLLLRRSAMMGVTPFNNGGKTQNYDVEFSRVIRAAGWKWLLDWSVSCGHGEIAAR